MDGRHKDGGKKSWRGGEGREGAARDITPGCDAAGRPAASGQTLPLVCLLLESLWYYIRIFLAVAILGRRKREREKGRRGEILG